MLADTAIIAASIIVSVCAIVGTLYYSEANKERIRQAGIDRRAGTALQQAHMPEWWQPVILELVKNQQVVEMITKLAPTIVENVVPLLNKQTKPPGS